MTLGAILEPLRAALAGPLPGSAAQRRMAPMPRPGWVPEREAPASRAAAVLVLLYAGQARAEPMLLYTERTGSVDRHKDQVSFPGGVIEPGETTEGAALREASEEAGVPPELPHVLGRLTPLWVPASGFTIHPVVASAGMRPPFKANPHEVRRLLEVPLATLMDPATVRLEASMLDGRWVRVPYFALEEARLWGASAMITAELLTLLGWQEPVFSSPRPRE